MQRRFCFLACSPALLSLSAADAWHVLRPQAEDGYAGVEVRVTPMRTEIIIRATRTQNVLGACPDRDPRRRGDAPASGWRGAAARLLRRPAKRRGGAQPAPFRVLGLATGARRRAASALR